MVLTRDVILKEIRNKKVKVTPFNKANLGPASLDLTLDNEIRIFHKNGTITVNENTDYKKFTRKVKLPYTLKPKELVLGITKEKIQLPNNICGHLQGRSRFSRLGLMVHMTASFIQPGIDNKQVLEIMNGGELPLKLTSGLKICQLLFDRCEGKATYKGKFKKQEL